MGPAPASATEARQTEAPLAALRRAAQTRLAAAHQLARRRSGLTHPTT